MQVWHLLFPFDFADPYFQKALGLISHTLDIWTDPNLRPFIAVTAHWVQAVLTPLSHGGSKYKLTLRSEVIAFHNIPGRHTAEHLTHALLAILDRINSTNKV
jgi:hypothetical protein